MGTQHSDRRELLGPAVLPGQMKASLLDGTLSSSSLHVEQNGVCREAPVQHKNQTRKWRRGLCPFTEKIYFPDWRGELEKKNEFGPQCKPRELFYKLRMRDEKDAP